jgi:hypothetical protein
VREGRPDRVESAFDVDVDHLLQLVGWKIEERPVRAHAGVGDEDVDPSEALYGLGYEGLEVVGLLDVASPCHGVVETEVIAASRCQSEADSLRGERARNCSADASTCSRDESHPAFERCHGSSRGRRAG